MLDAWNDGGAGVPASVDALPTGTLVGFSVILPANISVDPEGVQTITVDMSVIAKSFVASDVDSVAAPTYYRLRTVDGVTVAQATSSQVSINNPAVAIGDVLTGTITYRP